MNAQLNQTCIHIDCDCRNGMRVCLDCNEIIDPLYDPSQSPLLDAILREHERQGNARLDAR